MDGQNRPTLPILQRMKSEGADDPLLAAWAEVLGRFADRTAIFTSDEGAVRSFAEIEQESRAVGGDLLGNLDGGEVVAIQIGNHAAWPALLLACLRRQIVVLPFERTMSDAERQAALST